MTKNDWWQVITAIALVAVGLYIGHGALTGQTQIPSWSWKTVWETVWKTVMNPNAGYGFLAVLVLSMVWYFRKSLARLRRTPRWVVAIISIPILAVSLLGYICVRIYRYIVSADADNSMVAQITVGIICILFLIAMGSFLAWAIKKKYPDVRFGIPTPGIGSNADALWTIAGLGFLYCFAWWRFPGIWREYMLTGWFAALATGIALFALMREKGKKPFRYTLARWGMWIMIAFALGHFFGKPVIDRIKSRSVPPITQPVGPLGSSPRQLPPEDPEVAKEVREYFSDHPDLIAVAKDQESGLNHWERGSDGKPDRTKVLRGRIDPDDIGVFQINRRIHAELIRESGLNIENLQDNLKLTRMLYDKYGINPWARRGLPPLRYDLAIGSQPTVEIKVPPYQDGPFTYSMSKDIQVVWNGKTKFIDRHGSSDGWRAVNIEETKTLKFELPEGDTTPTTIQMVYLYKR